MVLVFKIIIDKVQSASFLFNASRYCAVAYKILTYVSNAIWKCCKKFEAGCAHESTVKLNTIDLLKAANQHH
jgi:hypothetical protein